MSRGSILFALLALAGLVKVDATRRANPAPTKGNAVPSQPTAPAGPEIKQLDTAAAFAALQEKNNNKQEELNNLRANLATILNDRLPKLKIDTNKTKNDLTELAKFAGPDLETELKNNMVSANAQLAQIEQTVAELSRQEAQVRLDAALANQKLEGATTSLNELTNRFNNLDVQKQGLQQQNLETELRLKELIKRKEDVEKQNTERQAELEKIQEELKTLKERIDVSKKEEQEASRAKDRAMVEQKSLENKADEARKRLKVLETELKREDAITTNKENDLGRITQQVNDVLSQTEDLSRNLEAIQKQIIAQQGAGRDVANRTNVENRALQDLTASQRRLDTELKTAKRNLDELEKQMKDKLNKEAKVRAEIAQLESKIAQTQRDIATLQQKTGGQRAAVDAQRKQIGDLYSRKATLTEAAQANSLALLQIQFESTKLNKNAEILGKDLNNAIRGVQDAIRAINKLERDMDSVAKSRNGLAIRTITDNKRKIENCRKELANWRTALDKASAALENSESLNNANEAQVNEIQKAASEHAKVLKNTYTDINRSINPGEVNNAINSSGLTPRTPRTPIQQQTAPQAQVVAQTQQA